MRVRFKVVAALVVCLLGAAAEAGAQEGEFRVTPLDNPFLLPLPLPDPQLAALEQSIQEQGKQLRALEERVGASGRYLAGGLIAISVLLLLILTSVGLLVVYLRRQELEARKTLQELEAHVGSAVSKSEELGRRLDERRPEIPPQIEEQLGKLTERIAGIEQKVSVPPGAPPELAGLAQELASVKEALGNGSKPPAAPDSLLPLEREILKETWNKFRKNDEIRSVLANSRDERWLTVREPLLLRLPQFVPEDLKPTFEAAVASAKDFHALTSKIGFVSRLVDDNNKIPPLDSEAQELMRLRELTGLLTMIQTSNLVADRLNFRLEPWIVDCFLGFADLFLQRYQKAQMEKRESQLQPGYEIVRQILKIADLEPVDLTLGVTPFDSARHIGRSTASDPNVASGVILGVIRNGFIRGGQHVIRQPEVIVNRA